MLFLGFLSRWFIIAFFMISLPCKYRQSLALCRTVFLPAWSNCIFLSTPLAFIYTSNRPVCPFGSMTFVSFVSGFFSTARASFRPWASGKFGPAILTNASFYNRIHFFLLRAGWAIKSILWSVKRFPAYLTYFLSFFHQKSLPHPS